MDVSGAPKRRPAPSWRIVPWVIGSYLLVTPVLATSYGLLGCTLQGGYGPVVSAALDGYAAVEWHRASYMRMPEDLAALEPFLGRSPELHSCCDLVLSVESSRHYSVEARGLLPGGRQEDIWRIDQDGRVQHLQDGRPPSDLEADRSAFAGQLGVLLAAPLTPIATRGGLHGLLVLLWRRRNRRTARGELSHAQSRGELGPSEKR